MPEYDVVFATNNPPCTFKLTTTEQVPCDRMITRQIAKGFLNGIKVTEPVNLTPQEFAALPDTYIRILDRHKSMELIAFMTSQLGMNSGVIYDEVDLLPGNLWSVCEALADKITADQRRVVRARLQEARKEAQTGLMADIDALEPAPQN